MNVANGNFVKDNAKVLDLLEDHNVIIGDPEDIFHLDWSSKWNEDS